MLVKEPAKAANLALNYYKDYLVLARQYKALDERFQGLLNTQSSPPERSVNIALITILDAYWGVSESAVCPTVHKIENKYLGKIK